MPQQLASASSLGEFFKGAEAKFGIFYPTGYLMAAFSCLTTAQRVVRMLEFSGFSGEAVAVPGEELVRLEAEEQNKGGLWSLLMQELSRLIATEEVYNDHDLLLANSGASFVVVYCPTQERRHRAWELIKPFDPMVARHYALDGIEHFKGEL
jgi:hypothetical protein